MPFQSIQCRSGGTTTPGVSRVLTVNDAPVYIDLSAHEVEECESIVAGDTWRKIDGLVDLSRSIWLRDYPRASSVERR